MVLRCMLLLVATTPVSACKLDADEVLGRERERPVPYPERLYTPRPQTPEQEARERDQRGNVDAGSRAPADADGGVLDGGSPSEAR